MNIEVLVEESKKVMSNAHVPYSNYHVGVALLGKSGKIYTGCNVENHGIQSICAERVAFTKAISEGEKEFLSLVVSGGRNRDDLDHCLPCGYCRQFMSEFVGPDFPIYVVDNDKVTKYTLEELLPNSFKL